MINDQKRNRIWHKDGDETNNWYKNLIYVNNGEYKDLKAGKITWQELNIEQEYIEYENKATQIAYRVYDGIKVRCKDTTENDKIGRCYNKSTMCKEWLDDPKSFIKWYLEHYYEVDNESMAVDKDLFGDGSGMYAPKFCCILPQSLNSMLSNCKKHYLEGQEKEDVLPLGVRYNGKIDKYYAQITLFGTTDLITLSNWDTPEEAFAEYKMMKEADIKLVAAKYKNKIPEDNYKKLLEVEVNPF